MSERLYVGMQIDTRIAVPLRDDYLAAHVEPASKRQNPHSRKKKAADQSADHAGQAKPPRAQQLQRDAAQRLYGSNEPEYPQIIHALEYHGKGIRPHANNRIEGQQSDDEQRYGRVKAGSKYPDYPLVGYGHAQSGKDRKADADGDVSAYGREHTMPIMTRDRLAADWP